MRIIGTSTSWEGQRTRNREGILSQLPQGLCFVSNLRSSKSSPCSSILCICVLRHAFLDRIPRIEKSQMVSTCPRPQCKKRFATKKYSRSDRRKARSSQIPSPAIMALAGRLELVWVEGAKLSLALSRFFATSTSSQSRIARSLEPILATRPDLVALGDVSRTVIV